LTHVSQKFFCKHHFAQMNVLKKHNYSKISVHIPVSK